MDEGLEKVLEDYKDALQKLEEYDRNIPIQISRRMFWEKVRLKAQKYDMTETEKLDLCSVPIPRAVMVSLEKLIASKELTLSTPAVVAGVIETFIKEYDL